MIKPTNEDLEVTKENLMSGRNLGEKFREQSRQWLLATWDSYCRDLLRDAAEGEIEKAKHAFFHVAGEVWKAAFCSGLAAGMPATIIQDLVQSRSVIWKVPDGSETDAEVLVNG